MFDLSAKAHIVLALNQLTQEQDISILNEHSFFPSGVLRGSYNGTEENSYCVPVWKMDDYRALFNLAYEHGQESVIHLITRSLRKPISAYIIKVQDNGVMLHGIWQHVGIHQPNKNAWTLDIATNEYYIIN